LQAKSFVLFCGIFTDYWVRNKLRKLRSNPGWFLSCSSYRGLKGMKGRRGRRKKRHVDQLTLPVFFRLGGLINVRFQVWLRKVRNIFFFSFATVLNEVLIDSPVMIF
jgi:hypothetical protein